MTFKVQRALLVAALKAEQQQLKQAHAKAVRQHESAAPKYQEQLIAFCEGLVKQAKAGTLTVKPRYNGNGKGDLEAPASPSKPKPDCRIADINELLKLLALSNDPTFNLNEQSKFYRYACKL